MKLRHIIFIILAVAGIIKVQAQLAVGSWKTFATFSSIDKVIDTPHYVYYITNGQLYSRDKDNDETYNYTSGNRLNDSNISKIFYNYEKDYLFIAYGNSNIDLIDSEGHVYNMPDIMDATLDVVPVINDVDFDGDRIYVATNFGIVVYDYKKKEVVTAGDYGINMTSVVVVGDNIWMIETYKIYWADKNKSLTSSYSIKQQKYGDTINSIMSLGGDKVVYIGDGGIKLIIAKYTQGSDNSELICRHDDVGFRNLQRNVDGSLTCHSYNTIYHISVDGVVSKTSVSGSDMEIKKVGNTYETKHIASCKGIEELWLGSDAGLSCYSLKDGQLTVLSEAARPDNALTFNIVGRLYKGLSGAIYASSYGFSALLGESVNVGKSSDNLFYINKIKDNKIVDITPEYGSYEVKKENSNSNVNYNKDPKGFRSGYQVLELPDEEDAFIVGSFYEGYYCFKKGEKTVQYDVTSSTLKSILNGYRLQANGMDFDKDGNLWVSQFVVSPGDIYKQLHMLKKEYVGKETTETDWQCLNELTDDKETGHDGKILACKLSNNVFYIDSNYECPVSVIKTKGTQTLSDDKLIISSELIDQDGNLFSYRNLFSIVEDKKGRIWVGSNNGIVEISDPDDISSSLFKVNHLKVPRNDGTNFADYLLDGETICAMAVDHSNRKWIATQNSGVYLVSENGDEILEHFDPTNSPLPDYSVFAVMCDDSNNVYFGTAKGLYMFSSMSAPAREDFSDVYAYPNPVRPDYTGWITITGLMENSLVKIADAAGNVFHQGTSEGGMMVWDGCDSQGRRVKTGIYYVFASHGGDGMETNGAVTKIMVVN